MSDPADALAPQVQISGHPSAAELVAVLVALDAIDAEPESAKPSITSLPRAARRRAHPTRWLAAAPSSTRKVPSTP